MKLKKNKFSSQVGFQFLILFFLILFSKKIHPDNLTERPIENRNLYLPFLLFLEPYPTTPIVNEKGKLSIDSGIAISNMIDNNHANVDAISGYSKYKPLYWGNYANSFWRGRITPETYYLSDYLNYGKLEQQSHVNVDAEIQRFHTKLSYVWFEKLEFGFELTALSYNTGIFDKPITGYHRAVGIPYPLRDIYPDNQFAFQISDNTKYLVKGKLGTGLGDSILDVKWQLSSQNKFLPAFAWINTIKLPTGNTNLGMGTGRPDAATGFAMKWNFYNFFSFFNLFGILPSDPFNSKETHTKFFAAVSSSLGYSFSKTFSLIGQLEVKGSPYLTGIKMINQTAVLFSLGFNWKLFSTCALRSNFTEDPITRTVPDVSAQVSLYCILN